ncbi:hypothetical protein PLCT2_00547 [Planctomycetaceae bacterium]|nr:hypothetical protein PLCT2_00547 [Planctomycetaceae bacterium]
MRGIHKQAAPACLAKGCAGKTWEQFMRMPCHETTRQSLNAEQSGVCCYCETELPGAAWHIEHLIPRSKRASLRFKYEYMAASCNGAQGDDRHCGHWKDADYDMFRFVSPHSGQTATMFAYSIDGKIAPRKGLTSELHKKANYMIDLLNLRSAALERHRGSHAKNVIKSLGSNPTPLAKERLKKRLLETNSNGQLPSFYSLSLALLT